MATGAEPDPSFDDETGAGLVLLIIAKDRRAREAEAALCRRYAPRIRLYGQRHLRDAEAARDLLQNVLLGVLEAVRAGRVREPDHLDRYILGICRNAVLRQRQKRARDLPTDAEDLESMLVTSDPPETVDGRALSACMDQLEPRARQVATLAFRDDRSADEIAGALSTTSGNVRVIRHRALAALRRCLDEKRN
jgi:RNA polymerase sigma-70 factor, ECF subfamily